MSIHPGRSQEVPLSAPLSPNEQEQANKARSRRRLIAGSVLGGLLFTGGGFGAAKALSSSGETPAVAPAVDAEPTPSVSEPSIADATSAQATQTEIYESGSISVPAPVETAAPATSEASSSPESISTGETPSITTIHEVLQKRYSSPFDQESLLAAANTLDISTIGQGESVFGIKELPFTAITSPEQARTVFNDTFAVEASRIVNLINQFGDIPSAVEIENGGVANGQFYTIGDLVNMDATERFAHKGTSTQVGGTAESLLQRLNDIAGAYDRNTIISVTSVDPQGNATSLIEGVQNIELASGKLNSPSLKGSVIEGTLIYSIRELTDTDVPGSFEMKDTAGIPLFTTPDQLLAVVQGSDSTTQFEIVSSSTLK